MKHRILVDTGPLVAILAARDARRAVCLDQVRKVSPPLFTCWPVITEAAWLLRREYAAVERLLAKLNDGFISLLPMDSSAGPPLRAILTRYHSLGPQIADAALVYLADREEIDTIFTLDKRDFTVYRTTKGRRLRIVP